MKPLLRSRKHQTGIFIIEALVSILIFMVGMIALVGIATQAINQISQTKYRNDASYLAGELIGEMWITSGTPTTFKAGAGYTAWTSRVAAALPGSTGSNAPVVTVSGTQVDIDIKWTDVKDPNVTHHYTTTAEIAKNI